MLKSVVYMHSCIRGGGVTLWLIKLTMQLKTLPPHVAPIITNTMPTLTSVRDQQTAPTNRDHFSGQFGQWKTLDATQYPKWVHGPHSSRPSTLCFFLRCAPITFLLLVFTLFFDCLVILLQVQESGSTSDQKAMCRNVVRSEGVRLAGVLPHKIKFSFGHFCQAESRN